MTDPVRYDWWACKAQKDIARCLVDTVRAIHSAQSGRRTMEMRNLRLYSDREYRYRMAGGSRRDSAISMLKDAKRPGVPINVVRNAVNAAVSMVTRGRPQPFFTTDGGDWWLQRKARKKNRFVQGILHREQGPILGQAMALQGGIFGTGFLEVIRTGKGPRIEPVFSPEILVDELEGMYGSPQNVYRVRSVDRAVLLEKYPEKAKAIKAASAAEISGTTADRVDVFFGWHLKHCESEEDGLHVVAIDGEILSSEPYKWEKAPFIKWSWNEEPLGYFGTGIPSEGAPIQLEINQLMYMVQQNMWTSGNMKVFIEKGSKVLAAHMNNDLRAPLVEYTGRPPIFTTPQTVDPTVLQHIRFLIESFYQQLGISQLSAQSQTPAASMSGKARLVHENSESQRFLTTQRRYDSAMGVDAAERILEAAEDCYEEFGDMEIMYAGRRCIEPVLLSDVIGDSENFDAKVFSVTGFSTSPSARMEEVEQYAAKGYYSPMEEMLLLDIPDTGAEADGQRAILEDIESCLSKIVYDGISIPPDDTMPLDVAIDRANRVLRTARVMSRNPELERRIPEENLSMLYEWRDLAIALMQKAQPPAPTVPAPPMGMAQAAPSNSPIAA